VGMLLYIENPIGIVGNDRQKAGEYEYNGFVGSKWIPNLMEKILDLS
jgi:hypothetical protein